MAIVESVCYGCFMSLLYGEEINHDGDMWTDGYGISWMLPSYAVRMSWDQAV